MGRWLLPKPYSDELFSVWLVRSALTLGCDPLVLTGEFWPKWRPWIIDIDRGITSDRMKTLVKATGFEREMFESMMLPRTAVVINGTIVPANKSVWPWMLSLGTRNRKRSGGLQYCPHCFEDDGRPYYRLQWRFAWHSGCPKHGCLLIDQCCACHAPLEPHRLDAMDSVIAVCSRCRHDLRRTQTQKVPPGALSFQADADRVIQEHQGWYGERAVSPAAWFELSRFFIRQLRKSSFGMSQRLSHFLALLGGDPSSVPVLDTGLPLEMLPVQERSQLFSHVWPIMQAGPACFIAAALEAEASIETLHDRRFSFPATLRDILPLLPNAGYVIDTSLESTDDIHPRSRRSVMRMMARLQRKYHGLDR